MSANVNFGQNSRFKTGWIILLVLAALMTLGYFSMIFFSLDELVLFAGLAALSLYGFLVIYIPLRRGEKWAWYATWILPIVLVLLAATAPGFAIYYYPAAAVCVLGLLLTLQGFSSREQSLA